MAADIHEKYKTKEVAEMIPFEKAYEIVMQTEFSTGYEIIDFTLSLNRVLAENVISDVDMPPFDKASVDCFSFRK